jgi:hypothetical protein
MAEERSAQDLAAAIYGTVLCTALIAAYSEDPGSDPLQVAVASATTAVVFWLAHAYSGFIARGMHSTGGVAGARDELARQWPLVLGGIPPTLPLFLGSFGVLSNYHAEEVAIATGIAMLGIWGVAIAWSRGRGWLGILSGAAASVVFGVVIVGLKMLVH